ncbi:MAG: HD domain-containing protein [Victivallaceae bacterium]|nr:HD domain-containing protein [Victivallaceae bacterium]
MYISINRRKLIWVLSSVVDLVGVTDLFHGKRVAYIADRIRTEQGNFPWSQSDVITACLLHDCGVSSTDVHEHLVMEMEWGQTKIHCARGEKLLRSQPSLAHLAPAIGMHHARWEAMKPENNQLLANLIFLADRIDVLSASTSHDILIARTEIVHKITSLSGSLFSPDLVEVFLKLAEKEMFWLNWNESHSEILIGQWLNEIEADNIEYEELRDLFTLFGACVDGKSLFTYNHSIGVAALAKTLAELAGFSKNKMQKIELAGLMHDLGKLKVPDIVLEKPAQLDAVELQTMRHHSFDTFNILSRIPGLKEITQWTLQHHEKLNGSGYPEGVTKTKISLESRILTVSDIFQALAQDRPYRKGLSLSGIITILDEMTEKNDIDSEIVELVKQNANTCMEAALTLPKVY